MIGMSKPMELDVTAMPVGATRLANPKTPMILKMLLPTTLPTAISRSPRMAATMEVTTSGKEVPTATMVKPMINSLTPR